MGFVPRFKVFLYSSHKTDSDQCAFAAETSLSVTSVLNSLLSRHPKRRAEGSYLAAFKLRVSNPLLLIISTIHRLGTQKWEVLMAFAFSSIRFSTGLLSYRLRDNGINLDWELGPWTLE